MMAAIWALTGDYTFRVVAVGSALLGLLSGVIGTFAMLRRQSLLGDGVSHAALPGVVAAFILTGSKNTEVLLMGALATGLACAWLITVITRFSRVKFDSALALMMSVFFGLGMVLLTHSQKIPSANQAGLGGFIYGQASTLLRRDVVLMAAVGCVLMSVVLLLWKEFKVVAFDPAFATSVGFDAEKTGLLLSLLMVIAIIVGLQTVGVVLMSALLIAPAVAARQWCRYLWSTVALSGLLGALSGVVGTAVSSAVPGMPTGPAIVICISLIALISLLIAPGRGILHQLYKRGCQRRAALRERGSDDVARI